MSAHSRPAPDQLLVDIADYVDRYEIKSEQAWRMARYCILDSLGCGLEALNFPECTKLLGPVVPGVTCAHGARVPGTRYELDPVTAAFSFVTAIRWLDYNDSFSSVEGGHPSDNIGAIMAVADYLSRKNVAEGRRPLTMREVMEATIKSYEIQGVLCLQNSFLTLGFDYITLPRVAASAVLTKMLGGSRDDIVNAVSNAWADGASLKIYRQGNNCGSRKSWAGGDAAARAVRHALMAVKGEMGYPSVLSAKTFGFNEALFRGKAVGIPQPFGTYVVENTIFKFVPAGNHGQTAVEAAFKLHPLVRDRLNDIASITIKTQEKLLGIMDKRGPLSNPADRDHCVQYIVAIGLIHGKLEATDFEDDFAADPRIDRLRELMDVSEDPQYTIDHLNPKKRSKTNAIQVKFKDGTSTPMEVVEYTIGHPLRRDEGLPMVEQKLKRHLSRHLTSRQQAAILDLFADARKLEATPVNHFMDLFVI